MMMKPLFAIAGCALAAALSATGPAASAEPATLTPRLLPAITRVDPRFQSYNVEMAEVVGAQFWAPYPPEGTKDAPRYQEREPLDLRNNRRLLNMTRALGPAYMRVSGTWANSTYFQDDDKPRLAEAPAGFKGVLTRAQWVNVVAFAKAVNAKIVMSFPVSDGTRTPDGTWRPDQARRLLRFTRAIGGSIAAVEPINEPSLRESQGLQKTYNAANFAKDNAAFRSLMSAEFPGIAIAGPSATGDAGTFVRKTATVAALPAAGLMSAQPAPTFDVFTYHHYTAVSERCAPPPYVAKPESGLTEDWLAETDRVYTTYAGLRDRFAPGKPIWVTEIGQAACGGDRWASTWADTFRYVDSMGRLARHGVAASFHNTLAASDYALIDDRTWQPRPSYWAALLWRKTMGETVLDTGSQQGNLRLYAHCLRGRRGGVALVAINLDQTSSALLDVPLGGQRYTLIAETLLSPSVQLNGRQLAMAGDRVPQLRPVASPQGSASLPPASITFLAIPSANNRACR
jgi:heparanase